MSIWYKELTIEQLNSMSSDTMSNHLDIRITQLTDNSLSASMPVNSKTVQPMRLLHGGASVVLAETLGSIASWLVCDPDKINGAVGVEINANHLRSASEGSVVTGTVTPLKIGRNIHVWEIKISDQDGNLCCVSRLTTMILHKK